MSIANATWGGEFSLMKEELERLCKQYEVCLSNLDEVENKAKEHFSLLLKWNKKISLTTITDPKLAASQLYFESLFATKFIGSEIKSMVDIGTGAGFPGLPISFALPELEVILIDSDQRKTAFLAESRRSLGLKNVKTINSRFEEVTIDSDLVTIRALEKLEKQIPNIFKIASKAKLIILFISQTLAENILETYKNTLENRNSEIVQLPESKNRVLLLLYQK